LEVFILNKIHIFSDDEYVEWNSVTDHDYCFTTRKPTLEASGDGSSQTDLSGPDIHDLTDKDEILRDLFVAKVTSSDKSVKFYTGIPNLKVFHGLFDILNQYEPILKYWRGKTSMNEKRYQNNGKKQVHLGNMLLQNYFWPIFLGYHVQEYHRYLQLGFYTRIRYSKISSFGHQRSSMINICQGHLRLNFLKQGQYLTVHNFT